MTAALVIHDSIAAWHVPVLMEDQAASSAVEATPTLDAEAVSAFRYLWSLQELGDRWNSYDARPIALSALQSAHELLGVAADLRSLPSAIIPTARGGVQFEWDLGSRHIEIEVAPDRSASILQAEGDREAEDDGVPVKRITNEVLFILLHG
jgi:hypothetical protein